MNRYIAAIVVWVLRRIPKHELRKKWAKRLGPLIAGTPARTAYGFTMLAFIHDNANRKIFEGGQDLVADFVKSLPTKSTFIDVGANQGGVSLLASQTVGSEGRVLAAEPVSSTYHVLRENVALNNSNNVVALNVAIGKVDGTVVVDDWHPGNSGQARIGESGQECKSMRLTPAMLSDHSLGSPYFVKIDVEGYEFEVLQGMEALLDSGDIVALIIEIDAENLARYGSSAAEIYAYLQEKGFASDTVPDQSTHYDAIFRREV